jgi:hypothetical protein
MLAQSTTGTCRPELPSDRTNRIGWKTFQGKRDTQGRGDTGKKKSVNSQWRCTKLSNESQTEGYELDAEEHLRNLVEAIIEREKALIYREHEPNRSENRGRTLEK